MADTPASEDVKPVQTSAHAVETKPEAAAPEAAAETAPSATPETNSQPSLLASADADKHEGAPEKKEEPKTEAQPDSSEAAKTETEAKQSEATEQQPEAKEEAKVDDKPKEALAEQPPAPPQYDAPKLPEGVTLDNNQLSEFDKQLGEFETNGKVDHGVMANIRQMVIDKYLSEMKRVSEQVAQYQRDTWNRINEQRINELKSDPQLGGNRIETTLGNAKYALESMVGLSKDEAKQLIEVMDAGGVSNHRLMIKLLHGVYERLREPEPVQSNPSPIERGQRNWYSQVDGVSAA